jgi:hypothetical protein
LIPAAFDLGVLERAERSERVSWKTSGALDTVWEVYLIFGYFCSTFQRDRTGQPCP